MQDRYAGDIGDFGKFWLLKAVEQQGLSIGINWYFTRPGQREERRADGNKPIDEIYSACDETLFSELCRIFEMPDRSVQELENRKLLRSAVYYHEPVKTGSERQQGTQRSCKRLLLLRSFFLTRTTGS